MQYGKRGNEAVNAYKNSEVLRDTKNDDTEKSAISEHKLTIPEKWYEV